ncbi:MAG: ABC transporter permease [Ruminiclostridium sp.]|nr:ABC transporter permease [Ruminiclostridium sp.]
MHGVLRLIQNELSKIYHQMSWKILTLLLLLLSIGAPILSYFVTGGYDDHDFYANAERYMEDYEEGSVAREYYQTVSEGYHFFTDQGFTSDTWQYSTYADDYISDLSTIRACQLIIEGKDVVEIEGYFRMNNVYLTWDESNKPTLIYWGDSFDEESELPAETAAPDIIGADGIIGDGGYYEETEVPITEEIAKKMIERYQKDADDIKVKVKQTFEEYAKSQIDRYQDRYADIKKAFEAAKTEYEKDKSKLQNYMAAKLVKDGMDIVNEAIGRTDLGSINEDMQNIFADSLRSTFGIAEEGAEYAQISEKQFSDNNDYVYFYGYEYYNYDEYLTAIEQKQTQYFNAVKKYAYSLEHGIPLDDYSISTRRVTEECLQINLSVVMFMAIFMAAVIVANEHTSGAVRLLMIRPRARWKILLSKLCCLLIYTVGWIVATSALSTLTNVIIYGGEDMLIPYIMVSGEAFEIAPFLYYLLKMSVYFLPALSMVFLAFLFSVLVKRAVVSMAIPMMINIFGGPASTLFVGKACKACPPLLFTPIPYFQLSNFWCDPLERLYAYGGEAPLDHGMTLEMGVAMFVIYSIILLVAAFVIFKKQQIKN